jgi:hypothetical protein
MRLQGSEHISEFLMRTLPACLIMHWFNPLPASDRIPGGGDVHRFVGGLF